MVLRVRTELDPVLVSSVARAKPVLRGVFHEWAFYAAIPLGVALGLMPNTASGQVAGAVFAGTVVAMFGASALYHRFTWSARTRSVLRRLDHVGIFGLIAGSYTPFGLLVLSGAWRVSVLAVVWSGALAAILAKVAWVRAPKWLSAVVGIALGWVGVVVFPQLLDRTGGLATTLLVCGGVCYTLGGVVYARRRPDPFPRVFGYHELFHVLVVAAVGFQYAVVGFFVLR
jgi:hemolysin III